MQNSVLSIVGGITLCAAQAVAQDTWYVDAQGAAPGSGTQIDPWTSLQFAIGAAVTVSGDTLLVAPGTYDENVDFLSKELVVHATQRP